ncbi:hypothetical protein BT63DRAFT_202430 [Microthyrium microscopicum]|uniref:SET domain-containing protein n=1 Tax=Microthyrium microscopicum TaxID=703497 RepID=A0A6A6UF62_9PEZI|nr:hypothetical protein BT63DRAFT_202430 [Microthyrium microscopicum]
MPTKSTILPKSWPTDLAVTYLTQLKYSSKITPGILTALNTPPPANTIINTPISPSAIIRIRPITLSTHPAYNQHGLFALRALQPDSFILLYLGYVHTQDDTDETSDYDLSMDRELGVSIDAAKMGNEARFINDYRGITARPNAEFRDVWIRQGARVERRIGVYVKRDVGKKGISKGEEIVVSYGKGFWNERTGATE